MGGYQAYWVGNFTIKAGKKYVVSVEDHDPRYLDEECIREKLNKLYMLTKQTDEDLRKAQSEQETKDQSASCCIGKVHARQQGKEQQDQLWRSS